MYRRHRVAPIQQAAADTELPGQPLHGLGILVVEDDPGAAEMLSVVLSDRGSAPTLVFDEIDTGVGGAVADAIGGRLARLAAKVQVMAVTHAPQVAARADQHFLISKDALDKGKRVAARVNALAADHRREEIARMLAGAEITAEARAAADRLLRAAS